MRDLDSAVLDALSQDEIHLAVLAEFDFISGVERLWAGPEGHQLSYGGHLWTSLADLGQIDRISEAQGLTDARTTVTLRVNSETVDEIGSDDSRGRPATLKLLLLQDTGEPIGAIDFRKTMGKIGISASAQKNPDSRETIVSELLSMDLLDETADLGRSHYVRMTYEAGLRVDATDHGLEFVSDPTISDLGNVRDGRGLRNRQDPIYEGSTYDR